MVVGVVSGEFCGGSSRRHLWRRLWRLVGGGCGGVFGCDNQAEHTHVVIDADYDKGVCRDGRGGKTDDDAQEGGRRVGGRGCAGGDVVASEEAD